MNHLTDPQYIKDLMRHYGFKPKEYMGQNFLIDDMALNEIIESADLKKDDVVLEVGPGLGVLTEQLATRVSKVIAVEKDKRFIQILKKSLKDFKNIWIVNEDVLRLNLPKEIPENYKLVANIPYYLTSKLIQTVLTSPNKPSMIVILIQKEVGERIVAKPGDLSVLGLSVQFFAEPEIMATVPASAFWPEPKVDSVIIRITPKDKMPDVNEKIFFRIIKAAFAGKRKQLHNTLKSGLKLPAQKLDQVFINSGVLPTARPQELSLDDWLKIYKEIVE